MNDTVKKFRSRRAERMGIKAEEDPIARYRERRYNRMKARLDAEENENGGNHGNTRIPFGLCDREGIKVEKGWTPEDAWNALEGKGYKPREVYSELQKTGKVPSKSAVKAEKPKMDTKQADSAIKSYRKQENKIAKMGRDIEGKLWDEVYDSRWESDLLKRKGKSIQEKIDESKRRYPSLDDLDAETRKQVAETRKSLEQELWETVDKSKEAEAKYEEAKRKRDEVKEQHVKEIEKLESQKEEYQDAIMVKYPTYSDCNNKKEFSERFNANRYFKDGHDSNFGRLDYKDAITIAEDIDSFFEMNPKMRGKLGYLEVKSMYYSGLSWPDHVELDSKEFDGRSKWLTRKSAFHGRDTIDTQKQTIFHEYTHQIDEYLSGKLGLKHHGFSQYVYEETVKRLKESKSPIVDGLEAQIPERIRGAKREEFLNGLIKEKVKRSVSMYAYKGGKGVHKDDAEFFAEAYSIFQLSKEPREVEKIVGQIVKEAFDKLED